MDINCHSSESGEGREKLAKAYALEEQSHLRVVQMQAKSTEENRKKTQSVYYCESHMKGRRLTMDSQKCHLFEEVESGENYEEVLGLGS